MWPLGSASTSRVLPMIGQPSSPGICVSVLRFGGLKLIAGEATCCIVMAIAPVDPVYNAADHGFIAAWRPGATLSGCRKIARYGCGAKALPCGDITRC